ncbi:MAG: sulfatase-like hydrolase/transferase [Polyangiaceae bacterium]
MHSPSRLSAAASVLGFSQAAALCAWLWDEVSLARFSVVDAQFLQGAAAGLFLSAAAAALASFPLVLAWATLTRERVGHWYRFMASAARCAWSWLSPQEDALRVHRGAVLAASAAVTALALLCSTVTARESMIRIVRPTNAALVVAAAHLAYAVLGIVVWRVFFRWLRAVIRFFDGLPLLKIPLHTPRRVFGLILLGLVIGVGVGLYALRFALPYLPLGFVAYVLVSLGGGLVLSTLLLLTWRWRVLRWATRACWLVLLVACGIVGAKLGPDDGGALDSMSRSAKLASVGHSLIVSLLDLDRDGHISGFGGKDCAPRDPKIYAGAVDIPGNGIDENCDGEDLSTRSLKDIHGRFDYPLPKGFPHRPPIILVTLDAFSPRHLASFGAKRNPAPKLEAFLKQGAVFEACFAQGPSTRLSFPAMFTSRFDSEIARGKGGRHPFPLEPSNITLAEVMKESGYKTVAVIPENYFDPGHWRGITQGFDTVDVSAASGWTDANSLNADRVTDAALTALRQRDQRPLFMWVHYYDLHGPITQPKGGPVYGDEPSDQYDAELTFTDQHLGRLFAAIENELSGQALVVLSADHGLAFDRPRHATAGYGYDLSSAVLQVPLVFHGSMLPARRVAGLCSTMDIFPTLANFVAYEQPLPVRGFSLVPELTAGKAVRPQLLFAQYYLAEAKFRRLDPLGQVSVRTPEFNLVLDRRAGTMQAYAWRTDFEESENLFQRGTPAQRRSLAGLRSILDVFVYETYAH